MRSYKIVQSEYKQPVLAAVTEGKAYLESLEAEQRCPFADYFTTHQLQDPQSYIDRTPSIGPRLGFEEGEALEVSPHAYHLGKLLDAAFEDTIKLYDPVHRHLVTYENTSDTEALRIIRGSLRLGSHYASLTPSDGGSLMLAVYKDLKGSLQPAKAEDGRISTINFCEEIIETIIKPRQRNGVGCSALSIMVYPPKGTPQRPRRLFDLYWDAMVVRAHKRYIALPSYQNR